MNILGTTYRMSDCFKSLPSPIQVEFLKGYLSGEMLFCDLSFTRNTTVTADSAVATLVSCLKRSSRKSGVTFRVITTGNLTRTDTQIHFHVILLCCNASPLDVGRLRNVLTKRWLFLANNRHVPKNTTRVRENYCVVRSEDEYAAFPDMKNRGKLQSLAYKWKYNFYEWDYEKKELKNDDLRYEDSRLSWNVVYSPKKRLRKG